MKFLILIAVASLDLMSFAGAQVAPTAPATTVTTKAQTQILYKHYAVRPPTSARAAVVARPSTSESVAGRGHLPPISDLPDFSLTARDGRPIQAHALAQKNHWLLVYRQEVCLPCDRLMTVLADAVSAQPSLGASYVFVVAGKDAAGLDRARAKYVSMNNSTWVGDNKNQFMTALKPHGSPMVYGMDGSKIVWQVPGTLGNPATVQSMAEAWVAAPGSSASTFHAMGK